MKKVLIALAVLILVITASNSPYVSSSQAGVPYVTYTMGTRGNLVRTQTAYVPVGILNAEFVLDSPSDIDISGDYVYIANTGMSNIVVMETNGTYVKTIGSGILQEPLGIFVDDNQHIYVADKTAQAVFKFSFDGDLLNTYGRPDEPLFGDDSVYRPEKIVVDKGGTMFITGEGTVNGVIQLNYEGTFRGYFGVNQTRFDWRMRFTDLFMGVTDQLAKNLPPAPSNLAIDNRGLIYTITSNIYPGIKKFNLRSITIMSPNYTSPDQLVDIDVDKYDNMFVIDSEGMIYQYDSYGQLLFAFGGKDTGDQRLGLLNTPAGISVDDEGNIFVLDHTDGVVQIYGQTKIVALIQEGNRLYNEGKIDESQAVWEEIYDINSNFKIANSALGRIYFRQKDFGKALDYFVTAQDRQGYSEAFWEVRNEWLQSNAGLLILSLVAVLGVNEGLNITNRKKRLKTKIANKTKKFRTHPVVQELKMLLHILKNPADTYYMIKREKKGSYPVAIGLYLALFIFMIASYGITSFLFNFTQFSQINLLVEFAQIVGILVLWTVSNYLISTLSDGEGWFRDIFIGTIFACAPLILGLLPLAILSNVLTYNEIFIYTFIRMILYIWTGVLIFIMVKEIHNYRVLETIKNIVITFFTMLVIALLGFIVYLLVNQMFEFIGSLLKEAILRVQS